MILNQLLLIPIIGAIIIAFTPVKEMTEKEASLKPITLNSDKENDSTNDKNKIDLIIKKENLERTGTIKKIALTTSIINFIVSLYL